MDKKIKIAIISYYSGILDRGVETFVQEITKRLSKKIDITVFQAGNRKYNENQVKVKVIKTFATNSKSSKGIFRKFYLDWQSIKILLFTLKVLPFILKGKYDFVIPTNGGWQTALCRIITKITKAKMIVTGHAGIGSDDAWNLLFRPDIFVSLTGAQNSWAKKLAPEVKVTRIPNGVDLSKFNPKVKEKKLDLQKPIVICTSALDPYKRVDLTIKAVAKTKNLSLLILGNGGEKGKIDSLGKRLLGNRFLRLVVPYDQIPEYYRAAKVFTLASKTEAFGIAYLEALASGLPVVTTNDKSRQEIIGIAGILTNPEDVDQYAKDLSIAVKSDYQKRALSQARKFTWETVAKKYLSLIEGPKN